jgi:polysaccharide biosynthesis transport protein
MSEEFSIEDGLIILQRRFLAFLLPVLLLAPLGLITVMLLPAKYTAQGTILVESQQIPTDLVRSTVNAYAQERISIIRQRVMTHNRLLEVADEYNLFPRSLGLSESERVARMRDNLRVNLITSAGRGNNRDGTIAFTVSYTDRDARKAFLVANKFMTLFLAEDVQARTAGASNTTEFFQREATRLRNAVAEMETRVSEFKAQNANALPEHLNMHLSMLERARGMLSTAESSITQLEEERRFLETQLISGASGDNGMSAELARLEAELARLRATYRDNYPEVVAKREEIASIKARMAPSADITRLRGALSDAEDKLTAAEKAETPDPEAIAAAEAEVNAAREALSSRISEETKKGASDISGVQIEGRIAVIENRIRMLTKQADETMTQISELEQRIARTPEVERGIASLTRDYQNIFSEYQDVLAKQQDAQLAENLEQNQQAEKFSILEPALQPDKPSSPDRPKLIILALFASLGIGGATALGVELLQSKLRGRSHLTGIIETQPIAVIPYIHSEADKDTPLRRLVAAFAGRLLRKTKLAPQEPEPAL